MNLVSDAEIATYLGISYVDNAPILDIIRDSVSSEIESVIGRLLRQDAITDERLELTKSNFDLQDYQIKQFDLARIRTMAFLDQYPVSNVIITQNDVALTVDEDYVLDSANGAIAFYVSVNDKLRNLEADYTYGYAEDEVPGDLKMIVLQGIKSNYESTGTTTQGSSNIKSKSIGDFSVSYGDSSVDKGYITNNMEILRNYMRVGI